MPTSNIKFILHDEGLVKFASPHTKNPKQTWRYLHDIYHLAGQLSAILKGPQAQWQWEQEGKEWSSAPPIFRHHQDRKPNSYKT